jgi:hypothetical protein
VTLLYLSKINNYWYIMYCSSSFLRTQMAVRGICGHLEPLVQRLLVFPSTFRNYSCKSCVNFNTKDEVNETHNGIIWLR